MAIKIIPGDCRDVLRTLPAESVHCCVTSPPYWGLRDYGVSGQIGLEPTIEQFVAEMVAVFREVRRVLRPDGTLWLNLGSSYASGDTNATPSLLRRRDLSCGTAGTEPQYSQGPDPSCPDSCDEPQGGTQSRHHRNDYNNPLHEQCERPDERKDHGSAPEDCAGASLGAFPPDARESKTRASRRRDRAACVPVNAVSADRSGPQTSSGDVGPFAHKGQRNHDTSSMSPPLAVRIVGKESFFSACGRSDCNGIGRCGLCFSCLAIASLNVKAKDELNIPHLVAMALQADGWVLRQTICWSKPNPMPESVTDRCTKAHEYLFLFTKSARYFFDAEAIAVPSIYPGDDRAQRPDLRKAIDPMCMDGGSRARTGRPTGETVNKRSVWTVATAPFSEAHFATFPPALIEPCILAGTSEKGCCGKCGAPLERIVEKPDFSKQPKRNTAKDVRSDRTSAGQAWQQWRNDNPDKPLGWQPTCQCNAPVVPCTVLDCFGGAGTTALVADRQQRNAISIELNPDYCAMQERRIHNDAPLFQAAE